MEFYFINRHSQYSFIRLSRFEQGGRQCGNVSQVRSSRVPPALSDSPFLKTRGSLKGLDPLTSYHMQVRKN